MCTGVRGRRLTGLAGFGRGSGEGSEGMVGSLFAACRARACAYMRTRACCAYDAVAHCAQRLLACNDYLLPWLSQGPRCLSQNRCCVCDTVPRYGKRLEKQRSTRRRNAA